MAGAQAYRDQISLRTVQHSGESCETEVVVGLPADVQPAVVDVGDENTGEESCDDEADVLGSLSTLMACANGRRAITSLPVSAYVCVQSATCHVLDISALTYLENTSISIFSAPDRSSSSQGCIALDWLCEVAVGSHSCFVSEV